jgi:hypothetical protein
MASPRHERGAPGSRAVLAASGLRSAARARSRRARGPRGSRAAVADGARRVRGAPPPSRDRFALAAPALDRGASSTATGRRRGRPRGLPDPRANSPDHSQRKALRSDGFADTSTSTGSTRQLVSMTRAQRAEQFQHARQAVTLSSGE